MSAITLVNAVTGASPQLVEFRLFQGNHQIARIGVAAGGSASVPTTVTGYVVRAHTTIGAFTLSSNIVNFDDQAITLTAEMLVEDDFYDFQLTKSPGIKLNSIVCDNTWRNPVAFYVTRADSPVQIVTIADASSVSEISTAPQWSVYAIVDGITTSTVTITDPDAKVTVIKDSNGPGYSLQGG